MSVKNVFVSHATADDDLVEPLRERLAPYDIAGWHDSRELTGGDVLLPEILKAIEEADTFILVLSRETINSTWVTQEVKHALEVKAKGKDGYKIIPLLRDGIRPSALHHWFGEEPLAVLIEDGPGGMDRAMPDILAALGERLPSDRTPVAATPVAPMAELLLKLFDPKLIFKEGNTYATATATLTLRPADHNTRAVESRRYQFTTPLSPVDTEDLTWYLEHSWRWQGNVYRERAARVEAQLPEWGKALYDELHKAIAQDVFTAWKGVEKGTARCFTVQADRELPEGSETEAQGEADEAVTLLLSLPWELLHDGSGYLFQGVRGVRVRRQLPNRSELDSYTTAPPLRVLVVSPRPEGSRTAYIDHRISSLPLVEALAPLGELAQWKLLTPPTFPAMMEELQRAEEAGTPYHVVHFDGHGVYDPKQGLGALCFEDPADTHKPQGRRSKLEDARKIAEALREYRIPLFFLEACQSAKSDKNPTASVAASLLAGGVVSVVAMSHSVLVETARQFVETFYRAALEGKRIGQAMLAGQRRLKDDPHRGKVSGVSLNLEDWFVPVLYQEENDPQLISQIPDQIVQEVLAQGQKLRLGKLPVPPEQTFVGRSRELLTAERILEHHNYVTVRGAGGEGKTTLACELARWLVKSRRYERAVFSSFEKITTAEATLSEIGSQLVTNYQSKAGQGENRGWQEVQRALNEQPTVIVLDNMETVLQPPSGSPGEAAFEPEILDKILQLCEQLRGVGKTRLVFTSREPLPEPFGQNTIGLGRLSKSDAINLVAKTLGEGKLMPGAIDDEASDTEIEELVEVVYCHARALVLITREVARVGIRNAITQITKLMSNLHARYPNDRECSLIASVKLSLDRLPADIRRLIRPLGIFQGGSNLSPILIVLQLDHQQVYSIAEQLSEVGLAEQLPSGYLRLDPALAPLLWQEMDEREQQWARFKFLAAMGQLLGILHGERNNVELAYQLACVELPNLLHGLQLLTEEPPSPQRDEFLIHYSITLESLSRQFNFRMAAEQARRFRGKG